MIQFQVIKWKNLLSTGNTFSEISLDNPKTACLVGANGQGKSTMLDALTFVLFNKPFRKINKSKLVNSINDKNCVVEIEFKTKGKQYKIVRGMKPNIFEIWCDNIFINKDSATKDYQEYLEKYILKMGFKSFCQIVILGSASFVPFMQLTPSERRLIIEDLLDIQVFSAMNNIVKQRVTQNKEDIERNKIESSGKNEKKQFIEKTIVSLKQNNEDRKNYLREQYSQQKNIITELRTDISALEKVEELLLTDVMFLDKVRSKHNKLLSMRSKIDTNKCNHQTEYDFLSDNENCPTCRQYIDTQFRVTEKSKIEDKIVKLDTGLVDITREIDKCLDEISRLIDIQKKITTIQTTISTKTALISSCLEKQSFLILDIDKIDNSDVLLSDNISELNSVSNIIDGLVSELQKLLDDKVFIDNAYNLLKDGGIKTKIIKQYLPVINKMLNKYLAQLGFFVSFNINETFEETIKSRHLEEFSYQNFSEGEKTRIDLAILFTWRHIAKMRNSVNCNLLIFDEIFDGSLDDNGTNEFLNIVMNLISDTNVFVISHKTAMIDKFDKVYTFNKRKNFSYIS